MNKINEMDIKEIFEKIGLILKSEDIINFCDDDKTIEEYIKIDMESNDAQKQVKDFIIKYEDKIDKEKLVFLTIMNLQDNLEILKEDLNALKNNVDSSDIDVLLSELSKTRLQIHNYELMLNNAMKIGKGIKTFVTHYYYDKKQNRYKVEVKDSQEVIEGKKNKCIAKNKRRFNEVDSYFKVENENEKSGIEFVLQSMLLTDLCEIFPDVQFGSDIRKMMLENELLINGVKTAKEIRELKTFEHIKEYENLIDSVNFDNMIYRIKETLSDYAGYMDIDKLLLISAYRFYDVLENKKINPENLQNIKSILEGVQELLGNETTQISCKLQKSNENEDYKDYEVNFSKKELSECINRFTSDTYLTKEEVQEYRNKIEKGEINLLQISQEIVDILFSKQEIENLATKSEDNLVFTAINYKLDNEKVLELIKEINSISSTTISKLIENNILDENNAIELYQQGKVSLEQFAKLNENINFEEVINSQELIKYYKISIQKDSKEEDKEKLEKYLALYKSAIIEDKDDGEKEELSNELIQEIIEQIDCKDYEEAIFKYYKSGIITLGIIADWNDSEFIEKMYEKKLISLDDLIQLGKDGKITYDLLSKKYCELVENKGMKNDERLRYIRSGFITEEDIIKLYRKDLIFEADLKDLANEGFIKLEKVKKEISERTIEELENNSSIKLKGLNNLTKINNDIYSGENQDIEPKEKVEKPKLIIDPNEREKFIRLLGGHRVSETDIEEESPFYNYEFYVIPDEDGKIGLESVVIAERYYEDKETESKFATNNATYFFKYKDLMVLSNLEKSEMTKERKNIVFTARHIVTDENKNGRWAAEVVSGIAKVMLESNLDEYSKDNQTKIIIEKLSKVYGEEQLSLILDKAIEIDSEKSVYEIDESGVGAKRKNKKNNEITTDER